MGHNHWTEIFDSNVSSIILYWVELWWLASHSCTKQVHIYACKRFPGANKHSCNDAILADPGRFPMVIYSARRSITFWLRILSLPNDRYLKLCYNMLFYHDTIGCTNWVTHVRKHLNENCYGYIWKEKEVTQPELFLSEYSNRMNCQYVQHCITRCNLTSKLQLYVDLKMIIM